MSRNQKTRKRSRTASKPGLLGVDIVDASDAQGVLTHFRVNGRKQATAFGVEVLMGAVVKVVEMFLSEEHAEITPR